MLPLSYSQIAALVTPPPRFDDARALAYDPDADPFQDGRGFIGPDGTALAGATERERRAAQAAAATVLDGVRRAFVSQDVLMECATRRADGVAAAPFRHRCEPARPIGDDAEPTPEEAALIDEAQALHVWAEREDVLAILHRALRAMTAFGVCYLRPYVPGGRFVTGDDGARYLAADDAPGALEHLRCEILLPDRAAVVEDPGTGRAVSVVLIPPGKLLDGTPTPAAAEVSWIGDDGLTRIAEVARGGTLDPDAAAVVDLRGRPLLVPVRDPARMVTPGTIQAQRALNTALTEMRIVQDDAGFPVRILLGAMPPGHYEADDDGALRFVPGEYGLAPGAVLGVQGEPVYGDELDPAGQPVPTGKTRPAVAQWDAADASAYAAEADGHRRRILQRFKQLHVELTGDAVASGVSRQQARQDFLQDAQRVKAVADRAVRALLETALDYAAYAVGEGGRYLPIRCLVDCRLSVPEPTPEERRTSLELLAAGVWTRARTMAANGVDEPEREVNEVEEEREAAAAADAARVLGRFPDRLGGFSADDPETL